MRIDDFTLGSRRIGSGHSPFVIAEMSGNHCQSLERALAIVDAAADCGAHALKIQTYTADTLTLNAHYGEFMVDDRDSLWAGKSLYSLYDAAHTPWDWHGRILDRARARGLIAFSTPFDLSAVDFLETLRVPCYKIASFEITHIPLIRAVAATGKPLFISTGMASASELQEAVDTARAAGCGDLVLLKCSSSYPATAAESNLATIADMRRRYGCHVGLSDHTMGFGVAAAATAFGAVAIEKHFTLRRADGGVDSAFSMEPHEMAVLIRETEAARLSVGRVTYGSTKSESSSRRFRQSIYVTADVELGESFASSNIRIIRPGFGLAPKHYDEVLGMRATRRISRGTALSWDMIERP